MDKTCNKCACNKVCNHDIYGFENCENFISAEDAAKVVHSKWMLYTDGSGECERCRMRQKNVWDYEGWQNFCGYCGAKMDGKRKEGNGNG